MKHLILSCLLLFTLIFSSCVSPTLTESPMPADTAAGPAPSTPLPSFSMIEIPAPSLANNMLGEPAQRNIQVYLPPSYNISNKHYPVVYFLPGFTATTLNAVQLPADLDALIEGGKVGEMIFVIADGANKAGGSFYVNSPVTGNWEDFIVKDLVGYVDDHFRTLPQAESRGISGHSMGGFGSLNIAMHHPDVFGAVYSLSPGLFDENGLEGAMFFREEKIRKFIEYQNELAALPPQEAAEKMLSAPDLFALAYGLAFAPNPDRLPPYLDYPFTEVDGQLVRDEAIWQKWESGFGGIAEEAAQYKDNLLKLKGIAIDYGTADENIWIPNGSIHYGNQLSAAGVPVDVVGYNGDHINRLGARIREYMLPFFSEKLKFE